MSRFHDYHSPQRRAFSLLLFSGKPFFLQIDYNKCIGVEKMRKLNLNFGLTIMMSQQQRAVIEQLADRQNTTLGEAARTLINRGIEALRLSS
jgi:hypothetical protein